MVGVPGKYKGCETCRRRRVKVCSLFPLGFFLLHESNVVKERNTMMKMMAMLAMRGRKRDRAREGESDDKKVTV